jgi:hypothetical protein
MQAKPSWVRATPTIYSGGPTIDLYREKVDQPIVINVTTDPPSNIDPISIDPYDPEPEFQTIFTREVMQGTFDLNKPNYDGSPRIDYKAPLKVDMNPVMITEPVHGIVVSVECSYSISHLNWDGCGRDPKGDNIFICTGGKN